VADATRFPVRTAALDYVLVYGALHRVLAASLRD